MTYIQLDSVVRLLDDADTALVALNGREVNDNGRRNDSDAANATRDLLRLADTLTTAAALARQQYWSVKGHPDVTQETPS